MIVLVYSLLYSFVVCMSRQSRLDVLSANRLKLNIDEKRIHRDVVKGI